MNYAHTTTYMRHTNDKYDYVYIIKTFISMWFLQT